MACPNYPPVKKCLLARVCVYACVTILDRDYFQLNLFVLNFFVCLSCSFNTNLKTNAMNKQVINARLQASNVIAKPTKSTNELVEMIIKQVAVMPMDADAKIDMVCRAVKSALEHQKAEELQAIVKPIIDAISKLPEGYVFEGELLDEVTKRMPKKQSRNVGVKYPIVINGKSFTQWSDVMKVVTYEGKPLWKHTKMGAKVDVYPTKGFGAKYQLGCLKIVRNGAWDIYPIGADDYVKHDDSVDNNHKDSVVDVKEVIKVHNKTNAIVITTNDSFVV